MNICEAHRSGLHYRRAGSSEAFYRFSGRDHLYASRLDEEYELQADKRIRVRKRIYDEFTMIHGEKAAKETLILEEGWG